MISLCFVLEEIGEQTHVTLYTFDVSQKLWDCRDSKLWQKMTNFYKKKQKRNWINNFQKIFSSYFNYFEFAITFFLSKEFLDYFAIIAHWFWPSISFRFLWKFIPDMLCKNQIILYSQFPLLKGYSKHKLR